MPKDKIIGVNNRNSYYLHLLLIQKYVVRNTTAPKKNNVTENFSFKEYTQRHVLHTVKYL